MKEVAYYKSESMDELIKVEDMPRKHLEHAFIKHAPKTIHFIEEKQFRVEIIFDITEDSEEELYRKILTIVNMSHKPSLGDKIMQNLTITEVN